MRVLRSYAKYMQKKSCAYKQAFHGDIINKNKNAILLYKMYKLPRRFGKQCHHR